MMKNKPGIASFEDIPANGCLAQLPAYEFQPEMRQPACVRMLFSKEFVKIVLTPDK
jgi:hypothetical protein